MKLKSKSGFKIAVWSRRNDFVKLNSKVDGIVARLVWTDLRWPPCHYAKKGDNSYRFDELRGGYSPIITGLAKPAVIACHLRRISQNIQSQRKFCLQQSSFRCSRHPGTCTCLDTDRKVWYVMSLTAKKKVLHIHLYRAICIICFHAVQSAYFSMKTKISQFEERCHCSERCNVEFQKRQGDGTLWQWFARTTYSCAHGIVAVHNTDWVIFLYL